MNLLPATTYKPLSPQDRRHTLNTIIEDEPQTTAYYINLASDQSAQSPNFNEDFPTPKAMQRTHVPKPIHPATFDELYDVTDDEGEELPLTASKSVRRIQDSAPVTPMTPKSGRRYPSLIIPSPSAWPTIEKYKQSIAAGIRPQVAQQVISPTPEALAKLSARTLRVPSRNATPSLDGSLTSEEMSENSCPSTPDMAPNEAERRDWSAGPVELDPEALQTLQRLSGDSDTALNQALEASRVEMRQVSSTGAGPDIEILITPVEDISDSDCLSALSIPSPGGFFSSLDRSTRHTWCVSPRAEEPSTSQAEHFYDLPWGRNSEVPAKVQPGQVSFSLVRPNKPAELALPQNQWAAPAAESIASWVADSAMAGSSLPFSIPAEHTRITQQVVGVQSASIDARSNTPSTARQNLPQISTQSEAPSTARPNLPQISTYTEAPSTAKRLMSPFSEVDEVSEITRPISEYNAGYQQMLQQKGTENHDRTSMWLTAQVTYMSALRESNPVNEVKPASPAQPHVRKDSGVSASGLSRSKSVRFADVAPNSPKSIQDDIEEEEEVAKESTFVEGFEYLREKTHKDDAWNHRRERAEALHLDRLCLARTHREQLMGKFHLNAPTRPSPMRPISTFYSPDPNVQKEQIEVAQKERQALEQIRSISWNLEATRMLNGGGLLTSPTGKTFARKPKGRVLDLGGQASCDWAWEVAMEYPRSDVYTVYTADQTPNMKLEGPANHHATVVPNLWTLPFPSNHFDVISARSLYSMLKTEKPVGKEQDEFDLCLREAMRCLKPGGFLEFSLLDADVLRAERQAEALSVEFCFSLRTRGYDPYPTKSFLPRLRKAGFTNVKRAWLALPMTQMPTRTVRKTSFDAEDLLPRTSIDERLAPTPEIEEGERGTTSDASFIAGLVGAWAWEKWMLKLQVEMGKEEDRLLEGVNAALEEGAASGAAWRYLSGWARKPMN